MQCKACGRRIFSPGLRTCPDCHASLAGTDSSDPAYASELAEPEAPVRPRREPPPDVAPAEEERPLVELPPDTMRWLLAGGAVLALLLAAPFASDALAQLRAERARQALAEAERQAADERAEKDKRWCAANCPGGVLEVNIDADCTNIKVGMAKRRVEEHHCNCTIKPTSRFANQGS